MIQKHFVEYTSAFTIKAPPSHRCSPYTKLHLLPQAQPTLPTCKPHSTALRRARAAGGRPKDTRTAAPTLPP